WFSPSGTESERAEVAPDGTFVYGGAHGPDETMVVVSLSHPLWVARAPGLERHQTITLRFPPAPVRTFEVSVSGAVERENRHIGIVIGGVRVPQPALRQHQFLRGEPALLRGNGPLRFRDLAETGPIEVLLGPGAGEVPSRLGGIDLFALPDYADAPRLPLPAGAASVTFELEIRGR
ncbi:MAG TPA: hypothetical protein VM779_13615, partial [Thermoanaerobaculia bacterium]|nr:hypothetical protein [Thermoanaerobaculia bacterium]